MASDISRHIFCPKNLIDFVHLVIGFPGHNWISRTQLDFPDTIGFPGHNCYSRLQTEKVSEMIFAMIPVFTLDSSLAKTRRLCWLVAESCIPNDSSKVEVLLLYVVLHEFKASSGFFMSYTDFIIELSIITPNYRGTYNLETEKRQ